MKKSHIFFGLAILAMVLYGIDKYGANSPCYEIVKAGPPLNGEILLNKCNGKTWTMVVDETTAGELGFISDEGNDEIRTITWTRVLRAGGVLSLSSPDE